jgi:hypothetical protein
MAEKTSGNRNPEKRKAVSKVLCFCYAEHSEESIVIRYFISSV